MKINIHKYENAPSEMTFPNCVVSIQAFFRDIKALQYNGICIKKIVDPDVYWPWVIQKKIFYGC